MDEPDNIHSGVLGNGDHLPNVFAGSKYNFFAQMRKPARFWHKEERLDSGSAGHVYYIIYSLKED